jgi:hypothetical protein
MGVSYNYDPDRKRVRVHMSDSMSETLKFLTDRGLSTTQAIREGITLFAFALRNRDGGRKLVSMNPDGSDVVEVM